jgi:hypothetical protein
MYACEAANTLAIAETIPGSSVERIGCFRIYNVIIMINESDSGSRDMQIPLTWSLTICSMYSSSVPFLSWPKSYTSGLMLGGRSSTRYTSSRRGIRPIETKFTTMYNDVYILTNYSHSRNKLVKRTSNEVLVPGELSDIQSTVHLWLQQNN